MHRATFPFPPHSLSKTSQPHSREKSSPFHSASSSLRNENKDGKHFPQKMAERRSPSLQPNSLLPKRLASKPTSALPVWSLMDAHGRVSPVSIAVQYSCHARRTAPRRTLYSMFEDSPLPTKPMPRSRTALSCRVGGPLRPNWFDEDGLVSCWRPSILPRWAREVVRLFTILFTGRR